MNERAATRTPTWTPAWKVLGVTVVLFGLSLLADSWTYHNIHNPKVYEQDWGRMLRVMGFLGTWLFIAIAIWLQEHGGEARGGARRALAKRRANLVFWSATAGGALAEVAKLLLRRERPEANDGEWVFRSFAERTLSTSGLALPSSHTLVAFAGAAMLARLYPRARWVFFVLAAGCGITRILARAHFLSDVVLAAGLGWIVAFAVTRRWDPGVDSASTA